MADVRCPPIPGYEPVRFLAWNCLLGDTTHLARKLDEGLIVALQVFPRGPADGPGEMQLAKARRLLRWRHPNIFRVVDVGQIGPDWYVALEHVHDSQSLTHRLERGPLRTRLALSTALGTASVLEDARTNGLAWTHWALSSILFGDDETAKLCAWDFDAWAEMPAYWLHGSFAFIPPEWLTAEPSKVSPAADVYRMGVALYAMLTGRLPFVGKSALQVLEQVREGSPAPVRTIAPDVPASIEVLCMKCLAGDPADRFRGLGELMQALSSLMADLAP